jgi:hypothetical protein
MALTVVSTATRIRSTAESKRIADAPGMPFGPGRISSTAAASLAG